MEKHRNHDWERRKALGGDRYSYDSHNGPVLTDMWCRGETSIRNDWPAILIRSVSCDPLDVRYAMLADDHRKVLENFSSDQVCPVVPDIHDWERRKALGGDRYSYYGNFDSRSRSSDYEDPKDYREWYAWSDIEVDERYCDPFQEEVGGESVITSCKSGMTG